jgi:hypothetical protein
MNKFALRFCLTAVGSLALVSNAFASPECTLDGCGPLTPAVPEPSVWAMMIVGVGAIGVASRLRKRAARPA